MSLYGLTPKEAVRKGSFSPEAAAVAPMLWHQLASPTTSDAGLVVVRLCSAQAASIFGLVVMTPDDATVLAQELTLNADAARSLRAAREEARRG